MSAAKALAALSAGLACLASGYVLGSRSVPGGAPFAVGASVDKADKEGTATARSRTAAPLASAAVAGTYDGRRDSAALVAASLVERSAPTGAGDERAPVASSAPPLLARAIADAVSAPEASAALKDAAIPDFGAALGGARPAPAARLVALAGAYVGQIEFDQGTQSPWDVSLRLEPKPLGAQVGGNYEIQVLDRGKPLARAKGDGKIAGFSSIAADPDALVIEAMPDTGYLQIYEAAKFDSLVGVFYLRSRPGDEPRRVGTVALRRQP